jgi:hypothetical protein
MVGIRWRQTVTIDYRDQVPVKHGWNKMETDCDNRMVGGFE